MDEQNSLRGQGFTLVVFGGLVALCAVFFILGMVVGRGQQLPAGGSGTEVMAAGEPATEEPEVDLGFYEAVTEPAPDPPAPESEPSRAASPPPPPPSVPPSRTATAADIPPPPPPPSEAGALMLQLGAFRAEEPANALASELRDMGFAAMVFRPDPASGAGFYRVRLGPFVSASEAASVRTELESTGYDVLNVR